MLYYNSGIQCLAGRRMIQTQMYAECFKPPGGKDNIKPWDVKYLAGSENICVFRLAGGKE
jgi:hypothetical protein